jgi:hypothetical protein
MNELIDSQKQSPKMSDSPIDDKIQPRKLYQCNGFFVEPINQNKEKSKSKPPRPKTAK